MEEMMNNVREAWDMHPFLGSFRLYVATDPSTL